MKSVENKFPPPFITLALGTAMRGASKIQPAIQLEPRRHFARAAVLGVTAWTFGAGGIMAFRRARTTINPVRIDQATRVVTGGSYRVTRNPMYVGLTARLTMWPVHFAVRQHCRARWTSLDSSTDFKSFPKSE